MEADRTCADSKVYDVYCHCIEDMYEQLKCPDELQWLYQLNVSQNTKDGLLQDQTSEYDEQRLKKNLVIP